MTNDISWTKFTSPYIIGMEWWGWTGNNGFTESSSLRIGTPRYVSSWRGEFDNTTEVVCQIRRDFGVYRVIRPRVTGERKFSSLKEAKTWVKGGCQE